MALLLVAVASVLSPARIGPYLPSEAARLKTMLITGMQLTRLLLVAGAMLAIVTDAIQRRWPPGEDSPIGLAPSALDVVIAGLLVAGALLLRVPNISESLWFDELSSYVRIVARGLTTIFAFSADGNNHIGNSVLMWVASKFAVKEWVLRLPSLLLGTLLPAIVYLLFQRVTSRSVALIAAIFLAVHFRMVDFSSEARGYMGHAAFATVASIAFASLCKTWNRHWAILYLIAAALASSFVVTGVYLIAASILFAGVLLVYRIVTTRDDPAESTRVAERNRFLWIALAGCWALLLALLVYAPTIPQIQDYSRNYAPSYHSPLESRFYMNAMPYLFAVDHHVVAIVLLVAACAGYWVSRHDWMTWTAIIGGPIFLITAFHISRNVASPRMYVSAVFPIVVGLGLLIDALWRKGSIVPRAIAILVIALFVADSVPVFSRYYSVGNPPLRQLGTQLPSKDVFLANVQAAANAFYFPQSQWEVDPERVMKRLESMPSMPRFVLWGDDCRRKTPHRLAEFRYQPVTTYNDWTFAEHADNQRRPCFTLYEQR